MFLFLLSSSGILENPINHFMVQTSPSNKITSTEVKSRVWVLDSWLSALLRTSSPLLNQPLIRSLSFFYPTIYAVTFSNDNCLVRSGLLQCENLFADTRTKKRCLAMSWAPRPSTNSISYRWDALPSIAIAKITSDISKCHS